MWCLSPLYMGCRGVQNLKPIHTIFLTWVEKGERSYTVPRKQIGFPLWSNPKEIQIFHGCFKFVFRDMNYNVTSLEYVLQRMALTLSCKGLLVHSVD